MSDYVADVEAGVKEGGLEVLRVHGAAGEEVVCRIIVCDSRCSEDVVPLLEFDLFGDVPALCRECVWDPSVGVVEAGLF